MNSLEHGPGSADSPDAWASTLSLCGVDKNQRVMILKNALSHPENVHHAMRSALTLTPHVTCLEVAAPEKTRYTRWGTLAPYHLSVLEGNLGAVQALKTADLIIDTIGMARGGEQQEILAAGARILLVREQPQILQRLFSTAQTRQTVLRAKERLSQARTMRVHSRAGTDFQVSLGEFPLLVQYGLADQPGRWDHWPSAFIAAWPNEKSAQGRVVLAPGDIILPFKNYVQSPISLEIRDGYIQRIDGDGLDADYLRSYMAMFDDREGYAVSHLGWGLMQAAQWAALGLFDKTQVHGQEARSFLGNFMFSTGPNAEAGGTRDPFCHLDMPMRHCSIWLDDIPVVEEGRLVGE